MSSSATYFSLPLFFNGPYGKIRKRSIDRFKVKEQILVQQEKEKDMEFIFDLNNHLLHQYSVL